MAKFFNTPNMMQFIDKVQQDVAARAGEALVESIELGEAVAKQRILEAITKTGLQRQRARGGHPGRYETGFMYESFENWISTAEGPSGNVILEGSIGWRDAQDYFIFQEFGDQSFGVEFEGMHAKHQGFVAAVEHLRGKLNKL